MHSETFEKRFYNHWPAIVVLTLIGFIVLALAVLLLGRLRADARRVDSMNRLRQLAFSSLSYEEAHSVLPSAAAPIETGGHIFGWEVRLMPFLDTFCDGWQGQLDRPWNHPDSRKMFELAISNFQSPHCNKKFDETGYGLSHYAATLETIPLGEPKRWEELNGDMKLFGEISAGFHPWAKPGNTRSIGNGIWFDEESFGNPEYNGVSFAYVDGSVRYELLDFDRR